MMTWSTLLDGEPLRRLTDERRRQLSRQWGWRKRPSGPAATSGSAGTSGSAARPGPDGT